jgi:hypothetical protein
VSGLCHVCGSTTFEHVDDSHVRCVECGHGATFTRMTAVASPNASPGAFSQAEDRMRGLDTQAAAAFAGAPFRPYALDKRWSGLRWFGGHGRSGDRTTSLTLAFGEDVRDLTLPEIRVETRVRSFDAINDPIVSAKMDAFLLARNQVDHLWRKTGVLRDDIRRTVFPRTGAGTDDPTRNWARTLLAVNDAEVAFAVLSEGPHWVAQAIIGGTVVGIQSRNWALETTGLATETEFDRYQDGAQELRRRMAQ